MYKVIWEKNDRIKPLNIIVTKSIYDLIQNKDLDAEEELKDAINFIVEIFGGDKDLYVYDYLIPMRVNVNFVDGVELNMDEFRNSNSEYNDTAFVCDNYQEIL